jgi:Family of unknown function (DUF6498)
MTPLIRTTCTLIAANLLAVATALASDMQLIEIMLVYWVQSIVIGICSAIRIRSMQRSIEELLDESPAARQVWASMPAVHRSQLRAFVLWYGVVHALYLWFLIVAGADLLQETVAGAGFWICIAVFAANHAYSLRANLAQDQLGAQRINTLYLLPFARIAPMHVTLVLGATIAKGMAAFILFCALKTLVDVGMHVVEHIVLRRRAQAAPAP